MNHMAINAEGVIIPTATSVWSDYHGITLCCSILNEEENIVDFIKWHKPYVDNLVIIDGGSSDNSFILASKYTEDIKIMKFGGHYGNQKNRAIELAKNDWVLFLDPDERMSKHSLMNLKDLINQDKYDSYSFPRKNYVDDVQDLSHGADHQSRLFRSYCRYIRPVHEELVGFKNRFVFEDSDYSIVHSKKQARHDSRNKLYTLFELLNVREMGSPGSQTEVSFKKRFQKIASDLEEIRNELK